MIEKPQGLAWQLLTDPKLYEARGTVQKSVLDLLGSCSEKLQGELRECFWLPAEALKSMPKITRGENYLGKPWMVLDFPRVFEKESVFAFRTMALFGDALHCTFHISGRFLLQYRHLADFATFNNHPDILLCNEGNPWVHHVNADSFKKVKEAFTAPVMNHGFVKFGTEISFSEWDSVQEQVCGYFREISLLLHR